MTWHSAVFCAAVGTALLFSWCARSAQALAAPPAPNPDEFRTDDTQSGVYVNDSLEAEDALIKAKRLGERGRWDEAARLLQGVADANGDKLTRVSTGRYVGARDRIQEAIARWPRAGLEAYRALYESEVQFELRRVPASVRLEERVKLFDRFFCTASAAELADSIGQRAIEAGDFVLADTVYRRVHERHPDRDAFSDRDLVMLALIAAMRGTEPSTEALKVPQAFTITWVGRQRPWRDVLSEVRAAFAHSPAQRSVPVWPIFGGDALRTRAASTNVDEPGLLWRTELTASKSSRSPHEAMEVTTDGDGSHGRLLTMQPVISGDLVVVQWRRDIVALHRRTGAVAWRFGAGERSTSDVSVLDEQAPAWDSVTVHNGRVYAVIAGDPVPYYSYESARTPTELVCLDALTGRVVWRLDQDSIDEEFAEISFDSSPLLSHDRLLVVGRRRRSFGFEDCFLYHFDAMTGRMRHRTHLGSASTGTFGSRQATMAIAAMRGDTVFVCSNLGTIAAVSSSTGSVRWLRLYERRRASDGGGPRSIRNTRSWHFNPILIDGQRLIVLPNDAANVLVYGADDGEELLSIPVEDFGGIETLLGVRDGVLCGVGTEAACFDLDEGSLVWSAPLPEGEDVFGRGVWADDALLVPTARSLCSFQASDGVRTDLPWEAEAQGGNLLALPDQLFVAGAGRLSAYVLKREIWKTLRDRMAAAPTDPSPALELAEVALNNAEFTEAITVLEEAVRRAESFAPSNESAMRTHLFGAAVMFADRLAKRGKLDIDLLRKLHGYAARFAPDAAANVRYRFAFAGLFLQRDRAASALRLYQQILRDRSLRELPADPADDRSAPAQLRAQERIASVIADKGRSIFEPFEREAGQWLDQARATGDLRGLQKVVDTFPNSEAAPKALVAQGDIFAKRRQAEAAARRFARAYHHYVADVDRPDLLRRIADAYEAAGSPENAYRWLTKAAREHPSVRTTHQGRQVSFLKYRDRLAYVRRRVEPSRPNPVPPLGGSFTMAVDPAAALLPPRFGSAPASRWSRFFVQSADGVRAFDSTNGEAVWPSAAPVARRCELLIATDTVAVFTTPYQVFALDIATGSRRWAHGEYPADVDGVNADWEDANVVRYHALHRSRLVISRDDGQMDLVDIETGDLLWSQTREPAPAGSLRLSDSLVVYQFVQDQKPVVCLVDAATGRWIDAVILGEKQSVEDLFVTLDDQIIVAGSGTISALDADTRRVRWQVSLQGRLRRESLALDVDALYLSDDGRRVRKISIEDGATAWETEPLVPRTDDDLSVALQDGGVIVTSGTSVSGVDAVTGLTLWRGTTPDEPRFVARLPGRAYILAVDAPREPRDAVATAYFYDHRNGSGVIARDGGALKLGSLADVRTVLALDGSLVIQFGSTIKGWTAQQP